MSTRFIFTFLFMLFSIFYFSKIEDKSYPHLISFKINGLSTYEPKLYDLNNHYQSSYKYGIEDSKFDQHMLSKIDNNNYALSELVNKLSNCSECSQYEDEAADIVINAFKMVKDLKEYSQIGKVSDIVKFKLDTHILNLEHYSSKLGEFPYFKSKD